MLRYWGSIQRMQDEARTTGSSPSKGAPAITAAMSKNITLYPWFKFFQNLTFWQAIWFLYFQNELSAADAILLYVVFDVATTILEVPSGHISDRMGRRFTLITSAITGIVGASLLALGHSFAIFAVAQVFLGASIAFSSGTDSALLYESLASTKRQNEIEQQELRAWRFTFIALAMSALTGGALALHLGILPFAAGAVAFLCALCVTLGFREPPAAQTTADQGGEYIHAMSLRVTLKTPVLVWLFGLSVLMYVFSHILFVFGQPFILEAMKGTGLEGEAPFVSGVVSTLMMILSVITSLFALSLRRKIGLPAILLLSFAIQIVLIGALALTNNAFVVAFLFLRMVPNSLSRPFIMARIQPLLSSDIRATYMSLQSFVGRLILAGTLFLASFATTDSDQMHYSEIQWILGWYLLGGLLCFIVLATVARRIKIGMIHPSDTHAL